MCTQKKYILPAKPIVTNVVLTFNASAISLAPSSPISFPVSQQTQSHSMYQRLSRKIDTIQTKHNPPLKLRWVNVVFTFNISARCLAPTWRIPLTNRVAKGTKCWQNRQNNATTKATANYGDSLTCKEKRSQCFVHFQRFGNVHKSIESHIIRCLFFGKEKRINTTKTIRIERRKPFTHSKN